MKQTHESYIHAVAELAIARVPVDMRDSFEGIKLAYGSGPTGTRGVTYYGRWQDGEGTRPFVEVSAFGQESPLQLAGTTIHELAHVLAGFGAGHGPKWKAACELLGLRCAKAAGHRYLYSGFAPGLREAIVRVPKPREGEPVRLLGGSFNATLKPCTAGVGTRGGKSRGKGSGSRLRLYCCECEPPVKVRVASDHFRAHCDDCSGAFSKP